MTFLQAFEMIEVAVSYSSSINLISCMRRKVRKIFKPLQNYDVLGATSNILDGASSLL